MVLRAREIMSRRVVTVSPDSPLEPARLRLTANRFGTLPVVDDRHRLVGVVTAADLLAAESAPGGAVPETVGAVMTPDPLRMTPDADPLSGRRTPEPGTAGEAMTTDVVTARPDDALDDVARSMLDGGFRTLPVLDPDGRVAGVVSRGDLLRARAARPDRT